MAKRKKNKQKRGGAGIIKKTNERDRGKND